LTISCNRAGVQLYGVGGGVNIGIIRKIRKITRIAKSKRINSILFFELMSSPELL
jgi:hypothetical protein